MFDGFDLSDFWDDSEYAMEKYVEAPPTDELIKEIEEELGYKLPDSYIWLMKQHNGGIPKNTDFPTKTRTSWAEDHIAISGIMGIGRNKPYSLCNKTGGSQYMIDEWEYPPIGVAICNCPSAGHDMVFLDYSECGNDGEPKVVHIAAEYGYKITPLADNFEMFIRGLFTACLEIERSCSGELVCRMMEGVEGCAEIIIPDGVTEIDEEAFWDSKIVRVHCPDSIRKIGCAAFENCENLEEITLPKTLNGVLDAVFCECTSLRRMDIPNGITEIGRMAFSHCESLETLTIPDTVTSIEESAFFGCESLKELYIPDSVTEIVMTSTFAVCSSLERIRLPENATFIFHEDGDFLLFYECPSLRTIEVGGREYSFDPERFMDFYFDVGDIMDRNWSEEEMKALLVLFTAPKNTADDRPIYDVSRECLNKIKALAD